MIMRGFQRNLAVNGGEEAAESGAFEGRGGGMLHDSLD